MAEYVIGKDPARIEDIWSTIYRAGFYRGGGVLMSAISGIDQALWDIKGKLFNAPVYQLMGGACRDKVRVYSWVGGDRPHDVGQAAFEKMQEGFTAVKMNATEELQMIDSYDKIDAVLERVSAIRERCGKYFGIAIDFHGRVHKPIHYNEGKTVLDYVNNTQDFAFVDGFVDLPKLPGLGVDVCKELVLEENKHPHSWKNPVWRHADGSVSEW